MSDNIFKLAKLFHDTYEEKAKKFNWETQKTCRVEFNDLPQENKDLMLSVSERVLDFYVEKSELLREIDAKIKELKKEIGVIVEKRKYAMSEISFYVYIEKENRLHKEFSFLLSLKEKLGEEKNG